MTPKTIALALALALAACSSSRSPEPPPSDCAGDGGAGDAGPPECKLDLIACPEGYWCDIAQDVCIPNP